MMDRLFNSITMHLTLISRSVISASLKKCFQHFVFLILLIEFLTCVTVLTKFWICTVRYVISCKWCIFSELLLYYYNWWVCRSYLRGRYLFAVSVLHTYDTDNFRSIVSTVTISLDITSNWPMIEILGKNFICAPKRWRFLKIKIEADTNNV